MKIDRFNESIETPKKSEYVYFKLYNMNDKDFNISYILHDIDILNKNNIEYSIINIPDKNKSSVVAYVPGSMLIETLPYDFNILSYDTTREDILKNKNIISLDELIFRLDSKKYNI